MTIIFQVVTDNCPHWLNSWNYDTD